MTDMSSEMTMPSVVHQLQAALGSADPADILSAAWDTFDLAGQVADTITWEAGTDELKALAAAQACDAGRSALPLPQAGRPVTASPVSSGASAELCAALLRQAASALRGLAAREEANEESRSVLHDAADQAEHAADALATAREA